jgi:hypothetical protein
MRVKNTNNPDFSLRQKQNVGRPSRIQAAEKAWNKLQEKNDVCRGMRLERRRWQRDRRIPRHQ